MLPVSASTKFLKPNKTFLFTMIFFRRKLVSQRFGVFIVSLFRSLLQTWIRTRALARAIAALHCAIGERDRAGEHISKPFNH